MNDNKLQAKGFLVWGICALFFLYEFFLRTVIGAYQQTIMHDLHLSSFQFSLLSSTIFLLIYGCMQLPVGLIVDKIGLKKSLCIGSILCTIACLGFASTTNFHLALTYRMLMGLGASFGFICLLIAVNDWMPHKYSAVFIGLSQFIGTMGPMLATGPLENISSSSINWQIMFTLLGIIGAALTTLTFLFVDNNREKAGNYSILYRPVNILSAMQRIFTQIQPWLIAVLSASLYFAIEYLSENEGRDFLHLKGIKATDAGYMLTISWLGYAIGCPLLGFLSDILERRKFILIICAFIALLAIPMLLYSTSKCCLQLSFFMLGISASGQSIGFAVMGEQFKKQFVAVGFGLNNAMITTLSAVLSPVIGLMLDSNRKYGPLSLDSYIHVFSFLIILASIALFLAVFFIRETYCKSTASYTILDPAARATA